MDIKELIDYLKVKLPECSIEFEYNIIPEEDFGWNITFFKYLGDELFFIKTVVHPSDLPGITVGETETISGAVVSAFQKKEFNWTKDS